MLVFLLTLVFLSLLYVCYTDIRWRLIKNKIVIFILLCSIGIAEMGPSHNVTIIIPLAILIIGFFLNLKNLVGSGDVKLLFALSVSLSNIEIQYFLLLTALMSIPVIAALLIFRHIYHLPPRRDMPYGVAIALGYACIWLAKTYY